ncbi:ABC transporter substrate-binding protein [Cryomorphaceae bacterium 1068]|nr:ABC transporter substrate-binding protein [Cryomorphaceae bacterium 1068]
MIRTVPSFLSRLLLVAFLFFLVNGCDNSRSDSAGVNGEVNHELSGGLFKMSLSDNILSIFPHNLIDAAAFNLMNQVYEGLFELDEKTNSFKPQLAESYSISEDGKVYTIVLKKGVFFHDDPIFPGGKGREVKAEDVVHCFTKLCEPSENNALYPYVIDLIKGASEFRKSKMDGRKTSESPEGLRLIDDYILEIELEHSTPNFLAVLTHPCCWVFPKELYEYEDQVNNWCIGTGPFKAFTIKMNDVIIFQRNKNYREMDSLGRSLPYLDAVRCNFVENERDQLDALLDGNLDLIFSVPRENIQQLVESAKSTDAGYSIMTIPGMRVEYYGFQHRSDLFENEDVRKAINYAIDRQFLVDSVLKGFGEPAIYGFVPPSAPGYNAKSLEGYSFDPDLARQLLIGAGFEDSQDFPVLTIQINDGNPTALDVAEAVQKMLAVNLGLTIELSILPRDKHYEEIELGNVDIWRDGWIADYPDPENFLKLFHGKLVPDDSVKASYLNTVRFKDPDFDEFFERSTRETNAELRQKLLFKADSVVIDKAAVAPLYYEQWVWLVNKRVQNLSVSPMGNLDLSQVYLSKEED